MGSAPLDRAWGALMPVTDRIEHLTSLVFLRQLTDPTMPDMAGFDSRRLVGSGGVWGEDQMIPDETFLQANGITTKNPLGWALDRLSETLNTILFAEDVLTTRWEELGAGATQAAVDCVGKWRAREVDGPDLLGVVLQEYRPGAAANGAFYTPWSVCLMMAMMQRAQPGQSVCDPCCGSGRMLLAALEAVREEHGPDATLRLYGCDIDHQAVRASKMNLVLAGYGAVGVERRDSLMDPPLVSQTVAARGTPLGDRIYENAQLAMFVDEPGQTTEEQAA